MPVLAAGSGTLSAANVERREIGHLLTRGRGKAVQECQDLWLPSLPAWLQFDPFVVYVRSTVMWHYVQSPRLDTGREKV